MMDVKRAAGESEKPAPTVWGRLALLVDWLMIALLIINLAWLAVDSLIRSSAILRELLEKHGGAVFQTYETHIHQNFGMVDMAFVLVFLAELSVRWGIAVYRRTYHRWFYYPLIHWYDVIGCIPIGSMRLLRVLRLIVIVHRMHREGLIDVRNYYFYRVFTKYRRALTEEVSDRVVVRVLTGVQEEIASGSPVIDRIWDEVVSAHSSVISEQVIERTQATLRSALAEQRPMMQAYAKRVLDIALQRSQHAFRTVDRIPLLGDTFVEQIEDAIRIIVNNVIAQLIDDTEKLELQLVAREVEKSVSHAFAQPWVDVTRVVRDSLHQSLEIVKQEVAVQQWKLEERAEEGTRDETRAEAAPSV